MELLHFRQLVIHQSALSFRVIFIILLTTTKSFGYVQSSENTLQKLQDFDPDIEPYDEHKKAEKHIFDYRKNGVRLDVKVVPAVNDSISENDEKFPMIPLKDLGRCVMNLSFSCVKERIARYIDTIGRLNQITLFGNTVKFVKVRSTPRRNSRAISTNSKIDRSIDEFFDKFALRITIPKLDKKKEQSQIDFMFDDSELIEGRGKGGGGKGGKGCKQMMMCMMMALKMKMLGMMGLMAMKGMVWAGMSMMMTKGMLVMKMMSMKGGGGPWSGGGGGGKAPLKEIVLLTKATDSGGGGGGGGGYHPPPPSSSYGPPSTGGGGGGGYDYSGGGGGGGWGRSFDNRLSMTSQTDKYSNPQQIADNLSIINTHPEVKDKLNINNDWESKDYLNTDEQADQTHIGEVLHINEPKQTELLPKNDVRIDTEINNRKQESDTRKNLNYDESKVVYANYWKNYEAADRIWDSKRPIVAKRLFEK